MLAFPSPLTEDYARLTEAKIEPITDADLGALQRLLDDHAATDPYQKSAAYYAMTGRDGLWWIRDGEGAVIFCRHPNVENEFLVFPPLGSCGAEILGRVVRSISATGEGVRLARFSLSAAANFANANVVSEDVLDWKYPVLTLDTGLVSERSGKAFQVVRTHLNGLDQSRLEAVDFDATLHVQQVKDLVSKWGELDAEKVDPYERLLSLMDDLPLSGRVIFYDGLAVGFSMWEETNPAKGIANAYAHLALHEVKGISQFAIADMCETLNDRGFLRVCIGGSETAGLDHFKQRFRPVESTPLVTLVPQLKAADSDNHVGLHALRAC